MAKKGVFLSFRSKPLKQFRTIQSEENLGKVEFTFLPSESDRKTLSNLQGFICEV